MNLIVAVDKNWAIGRENGLLVHLPGDLKYFKEKTRGKTVIMGRSTLESLPGGKPLPNRTNIVITRNQTYKKEGCIVVSSVEEAMEAAKTVAESADDIMVIGGASIYKQMLSMCSSCYITKIDAAFDADKYFPNLDENPGFALSWAGEIQRENDICYKFTEYRRVEE